MDVVIPNQVSFTRPSNTTAYAAGDVVFDDTSDTMEFAGLSDRNNRGCMIEAATLVSSANQATKLSGTLYLFSAAQADVDNDNSAYTPTDAQSATCIGVINFLDSSFKGINPASGANGSAVCHVTNLNIPVSNGQTSVFGVLTAQNAYTPVSDETFYINLHVVRENSH